MQKEYFGKIAEYGQLIIVSGPSGVGKKTIIKEYIKNHPNAVRCTSITTRPQRQEEVLCAEQYDYVLINDTIEDTVRRFAQIVHGNRYSRNSMKAFLKSYIENEIKSELVDVIRSL